MPLITKKKIKYHTEKLQLLLQMQFEEKPGCTTIDFLHILTSFITDAWHQKQEALVFFFDAKGGLISVPQISAGIWCIPEKWKLAKGFAKCAISVIPHFGGISAFQNWYWNVPWNSPKWNATGINFLEWSLIFNLINMFINNSKHWFIIIVMFGNYLLPNIAPSYFFHSPPPSPTHLLLLPSSCAPASAHPGQAEAAHCWALPTCITTNNSLHVMMCMHLPHPLTPHHHHQQPPMLRHHRQQHQHATSQPTTGVHATSLLPMTCTPPLMTPNMPHHHWQHPPTPSHHHQQATMAASPLFEGCRHWNWWVGARRSEENGKRELRGGGRGEQGSRGNSRGRGRLYGIDKQGQCETHTLPPFPFVYLPYHGGIFFPPALMNWGPHKAHAAPISACLPPPYWGGIYLFLLPSVLVNVH